MWLTTRPLRLLSQKDQSCNAMSYPMLWTTQLFMAGLIAESVVGCKRLDQG